MIDCSTRDKQWEMRRGEFLERHQRWPGRKKVLTLDGFWCMFTYKRSFVRFIQLLVFGAELQQ